MFQYRKNGKKLVLAVIKLLLVHIFSAATGSIENLLIGTVEFVDGGYDLRYFPNENIATLWPSTHI